MKSQKKVIEKVIWRIKSIDLVSFKAEDNLIKPHSEYNPDKINFELGVELNMDPKQNQITVGFPVKIFSDETRTELVGSINTKGEFQIQNFQEIVDAAAGKFPPTLLAVLVGVMLSTTRGMLVLLSKATVFDKAIIPIINPMVFFDPKLAEK